MNDDVKVDVIKRTQDLLGKYIKKPPLTEKLLKKPPFRFLHDIITSVINGTGFLDGILTSAEMNHQNIKDKETKIAFLQKVIDAVKESTGILLTVRPNKIVAGHEPTKTNEFLQAIAKGIESQRGASVTTPAQPAKKGTAAKTLSNQLSKQGSSKDKPLATTSRQTKPQQRNLSQDRLKTKDGDKKKLATTTTIKANINAKESVSQSKVRNEVLNSTRQTVQPVVPDVLGAKVDPPIADSEQEIIEPVDESMDSVHAADTEVPLLPQEVEMTRPPSAHFRQRNLTVLRNPDDADNNDSGEPIITQPIPINQKEDISRVHNFGDDITASDTRAENVLSRRPMSTRPPSVRPASARPAAPRIRDRGEVSRTEETRPVSRQVNVITENDTMNDKEADEFLIKTKPVTGEEQLMSESTLQPAEEGKHGHLVDQILETQKDLGDNGVRSTTSREPHTKKTDIEWEGGRKRDRETVKQEVAKLRELVQKTARIVNPAGKRMEFVQEDVDTMNRDLETWMDTIKQLSLQLQEEQRLTDQAVEPMKMQQAQLEEMILEKRAQISALKATVLQNDKRIKRLLLGEVVSN